MQNEQEFYRCLVSDAAGRTLKKMCTVRTMSFRRADRTAVGHETEVRYIARITV